MTSPPSPTTARWSFNFRLGGGLWAVNWNALPHALLSVGVLRSRTAQPASAAGFVWTGRRAWERGRAITPVPSQWNYTAIAAVYMELLFLVFLVSVSRIFTYDCPGKFARFLLSVKKWLSTTRHPNPNVYSVTSSSNIRACLPAREKNDYIAKCKKLLKTSFHWKKKDNNKQLCAASCSCYLNSLMENIKWES